jgi:hypothetical protein
LKFKTTERIFKDVLFVCNFTKTARHFAKISSKTTFHSKPLAPSKIILDYGSVERRVMKMNNLNKKLINNLILGNSMFGISASIITQVQATQRLHTPTRKMYKYVSSTINNLGGRLYRRNLSMEECIGFVKD